MNESGQHNRSAAPITANESRYLRNTFSVRSYLRFRLRTVFALLFLTCLALTIAYYVVFQPRGALRGPTLRLHANGAVTFGSNAAQPLSEEALASLLDRATEQYRKARGQDSVSIERFGLFGWQDAEGPPVTLVVDTEATHALLDSLLHTCVEHGIEKFVMKDVAAKRRPFDFVLFKDLPCEGIPDPCMLPPVLLSLKATDNGNVHSISLNDRQIVTFAELRNYLIRIIGPQRGRNSIQASIEMQMRCDKQLRIRHVFDARDASSGYRANDGQWVALVDRIRPVDWGTGWLDIDDVEIEHEEVSEVMDKGVARHGTPNAW